MLEKKYKTTKILRSLPIGVSAAINPIEHNYQSVYRAKIRLEKEGYKFSVSYKPKHLGDYYIHIIRLQ